MLDQLEQTIASVAGTAAGSLVSIGRNGRGSGFVVADGRVLTSAHNLRDRTVTVTFDDGGTPTDPSDDGEGEFVSLDKISGLRETDGRDFCTDIALFLG